MGGYNTKESNAAFLEFDKDGDGLLKGPELEAWVASMTKLLETLAANLGVSVEEAKRHVLAAVTAYAEDGVSEEQFTAVLDPQGERDLFRRSVFAAFCPSPDGELDAEGLKRMLDAFYKDKEAGGVFAGDARLDYETGGSQRLIEVLGAHAARRRALAKLPPGTGVSYEDLAPVMAGRVSELRGAKSVRVREAGEVSAGGPTAYYLDVEWMGGEKAEAVKRYRDFDHLLIELGQTSWAQPDTQRGVVDVWPPKCWYGSTDPEVVDKRVTGFNAFLALVSADPIARVHPTFCAFLGAGGAQYSKSPEAVIPDDPDSVLVEAPGADDAEDEPDMAQILEVMQAKGYTDTELVTQLSEITTDTRLLESLYFYRKQPDR
eukprot:Hpha_TRINITY_DN15180_c2_g4::TRINITY_DN15180_c2_g4_i1::g.127865::m.127865